MVDIKDKWLTIDELVDQGFLDALFPKAKTRSGKYQAIMKLLKKGILKSVNISTGKTFKPRTKLSWVKEFISGQ